MSNLPHAPGCRPCLACATDPEVLAAWHGRFVSRGERYAAIRFSDVGQAGAWARASFLVSRVSFAKPPTDLSSPVTVLLDCKEA
jgi:hypothetical protein